jgi:alkylation response protein AidB-like acyl-CoA dehydrogenase
MATVARRDGDGWVINGTKNWISNLGVADFYIVFAVSDRPRKRITAFVVEADRPVSASASSSTSSGSADRRPAAELRGRRVPEENVIGAGRKGPARWRSGRSSAHA